ncbi:glycosyltransferase [Streptomyces sp. NPDC048825]|uniref:glycosyltransferase n=1 Tax=Streptomyces sp. NPDC048825 TaxID=3365592 RepID=UPI00371B9548
MNATGRRFASGAGVPVADVPAYVPARVVDIDLAVPGEFSPPGGGERIRPQGRVLALVRLYGHPLGMVAADGADPQTLWRALVEATERELSIEAARLPPADRAYVPADGPGSAPSPDGADAGSRRGATLRGDPPSANPPHDLPDISVIVPTHNRCHLLRQCLDSLLGMEYPTSRFEVIVVDNAPADEAAEQLIHKAYSSRVRYVKEPVVGGARARSRGLAAANGSITAFADDDTLVDTRWLSALAEAFSRDRRIGCVTGLIIPAELETAAQAALERHGGFSKGYSARAWSLDDPPEDPLFPFTAGHFGSGANMAFRTDLLRKLGGFDPATGPGTPARGGEDLLAFFQVVVSGHTLTYQPDAIVWHRHRRTPDALSAQAFGYGAGFGAYLTGALAHEPRMLPVLLRRLPGGIRYAAGRARTRTSSQGSEWSPRLTLLEIRGLLYGPLGYLRSRNRCLKHNRSSISHADGN